MWSARSITHPAKSLCGLCHPLWLLTDGILALWVNYTIRLFSSVTTPVTTTFNVLIVNWSFISRSVFYRVCVNFFGFCLETGKGTVREKRERARDRGRERICKNECVWERHRWKERIRKINVYYEELLGKIKIMFDRDDKRTRIERGERNKKRCKLIGF